MNKEYGSFIQDMADTVVTEYITNEAGIAIQNVFEKKDGAGCQCPSCLKRVANEANSWIQYIATDEMDVDHLFFYYDSKTRGLKQKLTNERRYHNSPDNENSYPISY